MAQVLLKKRAVQKQLDISGPTLDRRIRAGEIAVVRLGARSVRIAEDELERYIEARTSRR